MWCSISRGWFSSALSHLVFARIDHCSGFLGREEFWDLSLFNRKFCFRQEDIPSSLTPGSALFPIQAQQQNRLCLNSHGAHWPEQWLSGCAAGDTQRPLETPWLSPVGGKSARWLSFDKVWLFWFHSSTHILAWRIPWTEALSRLRSIGLQRVGHDWSDSGRTHT